MNFCEQEAPMVAGSSGEASPHGGPMRILLLVNYFLPEIGSGPHLPYELGETLVERGHEVTVATGFPRYNVPVMPDKYRGRFFFREEMAGMTVLRVRSPVPYGKGKLTRGAFHLLAPVVTALSVLPLSRPDVVYSITPPLISGLIARMVARRFRVPCVVNVQDLFPQSAVDLGVLRNPAAVRFFEWMERRIYRSADLITVMSDGNGRHVIKRGGTPDRVQTIANWVDTDMIRPAERMNSFRREQGIDGRFVVLFAGTMGWSQGIEVVVEAAKQLSSEPQLLFLFVGAGVEREKLEQAAAGLPNVRFLPMQSKAVYPQMLAAADACLVTLRPEVATPTVPSKISTIMAAGRPILAALPPGDAPQLINDTASGIVVPAGDSGALAGAVMRLKQDPAAAHEMGLKGRAYAEQHLSRRTCVSKIEQACQALVRNRR